MGAFIHTVFIERNCTRIQLETAIDNFYSIRVMALLCGMLDDLPKVSSFFKIIICFRIVFL